MSELSEAIKPPENTDLRNIPISRLIEELRSRKLSPANVSILQSLKPAEEIGSQTSSDSFDKLDKTDELSKKVISAVVNNFKPDGSNYSKGDQDAKEILYSIMNSDRRLSNYLDEKNCTTMITIPLSSSVIENLHQKFSKQDMATCFTYRGIGVDDHKRNSNLRALLIMSKENANKLAEEVKDNPQLAYFMIRKANGGAIQMYDGKPARINPGTHIEIMSNSRLGGDRAETIQSKPFPLEFQANPIT